MGRKHHPDKDIETALQYAEAHGWQLKLSKGHAWGRMYCPHNSKACRCGQFCVSSIWSTPRSSTIHARQIRRIVDKCIAVTSNEEEEK